MSAGREERLREERKAFPSKDHIKNTEIVLAIYKEVEEKFQLAANQAAMEAEAVAKAAGKTEKEVQEITEKAKRKVLSLDAFANALSAVFSEVFAEHDLTNDAVYAELMQLIMHWRNIALIEQIDNKMLKPNDQAACAMIATILPVMLKDLQQEQEQEQEKAITEALSRIAKKEKESDEHLKKWFALSDEERQKRLASSPSSTTFILSSSLSSGQSPVFDQDITAGHSDLSSSSESVDSEENSLVLESEKWQGLLFRFKEEYKGRGDYMTKRLFPEERMRYILEGAKNGLNQIPQGECAKACIRIGWMDESGKLREDLASDFPDLNAKLPPERHFFRRS